MVAGISSLLAQSGRSPALLKRENFWLDFFVIDLLFMGLKSRGYITIFNLALYM
jgi:hypothetical protein